MEQLHLIISPYADSAHWQWQLIDIQGNLLALQRVALDTSSAEYEAFEDLYRYLRWRVAPDRRDSGEPIILNRLGRWIADNVFGKVGVAIIARAQRGPVVVRVRIPTVASQLFARPFELAQFFGKTLAEHNVTLVLEQGSETRARQATGFADQATLRILGVFSLPIDERAIAVRRERYLLAQLFDSLSHDTHAAIDFQAVQYGVTRSRLEGVLTCDEGWDIVHVSAHGIPGGVLLEKDDGGRDVVGTRQLGALLRRASGRLRLVTLSSCESAADQVRGVLHSLGVDARAGRGDLADTPSQFTLEGSTDETYAGRAAPSLTSLRSGGRISTMAAEIATSLNCAVVAMRYPVDDDFAVEFSTQLYRALLCDCANLPHAVQHTLKTSAATKSALSKASPALFGGLAASLQFVPPRREKRHKAPAKLQSVAGLPKLPERFVGSTDRIIRANTALAPNADKMGVLLYGMAGVGKTTFALELIYGHEHDFETFMFHRFPEESSGEPTPRILAGLLSAIEQAFRGLNLVRYSTDREKLAGELQRLNHRLASDRALIVLDNAESTLGPDGGWKDDRIGSVIDAIVENRGNSKLIITTRRRPTVTSNYLLTEIVNPLSITESTLLARELPNLRAMLTRPVVDLEPDGRELFRKVLNTAQGHPVLLELADQYAANQTSLNSMLSDIQWATSTSRISAADGSEARLESVQETYSSVLARWTRSVVRLLPDEIGISFQFLACIEDQDRTAEVFRSTWPQFWKNFTNGGLSIDTAELTGKLREQGLISHVGTTGGQTILRIHATVAEAGRSLVGPRFRSSVDEHLASHWNMQIVEAATRQPYEQGDMLRAAARNIVPYLLRLERYEDASIVIAMLIIREASPSALANVLPYLDHICARSDRISSLALVDQFRRLRILVYADVLQPSESISRLENLLDIALGQTDLHVASDILGHLIIIALRSGNIAKVDGHLRLRNDISNRLSGGPLRDAADEILQLKVSFEMNDPLQVYTASLELQQRIGAIQLHEDEGPDIAEWSVKEDLYQLISDSAGALQRWDRALYWNAMRLTSMRRRIAHPLELARARFADHFALARLGFLQEARDLVHSCRAEFEAEHDFGSFRLALTALADLEDEIGRPEQAAELETDALRFEYLNENAHGAAVSHLRLAFYLRKCRTASSVILAHCLAGALINSQIAHRDRHRNLYQVAQELAAYPEGSTPPGTLRAVEEIVDEVDGVQFAHLLSQFPGDDQVKELALQDLLERAQTMATDGLGTAKEDLRPLAALYGTIVSYGHPDIVDRLRRALQSERTPEDWSRLLGGLRRVWEAGRSSDLTVGLGPGDAAIVQFQRDLLSGAVDLPEIFAAITSSPSPIADDVPGLSAIRRIIAALVTAPPGGQFSAIEKEIERLSDENDPDVGNLALLILRHFSSDRLMSAEELVQDIASPQNVAERIAAMSRTIVTDLATNADAELSKEDYRPLIAAVAAAAKGDAIRSAGLESMLDRMAGDPAWRPLATTLRRIVLGETGVELCNGLSPSDRAIVEEVIGLL